MSLYFTLFMKFLFKVQFVEKQLGSFQSQQNIWAVMCACLCWTECLLSITWNLTWIQEMVRHHMFWLKVETTSNHCQKIKVYYILYLKSKLLQIMPATAVLSFYRKLYVYFSVSSAMRLVPSLTSAELSWTCFFLQPGTAS